MDDDPIPVEKVDEVQELGIASVVDVFPPSNVMDQPVTSPPPRRISPEVSRIKLLLKIDTADCCTTIKSTSFGCI